MITARTETQHRPPAADPRRACNRYIVLDCKHYACGREHGHDGIHDAFARHADDGIVRW